MMTKLADSSTRRRGRIHCLMLSVAALLSWGAFGLATSSAGESARVSILNEVAAMTAMLPVKTRTTLSIPEQATRFRAAIAAGDDAAAKAIVETVLAGSKSTEWGSHPFDGFMTALFDVDDPAIEGNLNRWVARDAAGPIPVLLRAQFEHDHGWNTRGHDYANKVLPADMLEFVDYLNRAHSDIDTAIQRGDTIPYAHALKLRILQSIGKVDAFAPAFRAAIARYPGYYPLYRLALSTLQPKWGGNLSAMVAFVETYAGGAPERSPLKLLAVELYASILNDAANRCSSLSSDEKAAAACVATTMHSAVPATLENQVVAALSLYDHADHAAFGKLLYPTLISMMGETGGESYAGAVLQLAATAMHSDPRMVQEKPVTNDYIIDLVVGNSWFRKGFYENAQSHYERALTDVQAMTFATPEDRDLAVAKVLSGLAKTHAKLQNFPEVMSYERAALALGGRDDQEHYLCYAFYRLKLYEDGAKACSEAVTLNPANMATRYWRAETYSSLKRSHDAETDFRAVAESKHAFRPSAAIALSMVYFRRNDNQSALQVLNRYTYVYDTRVTSKSDVAVAYNNRCYALMELGKLKEALADCTESLKFGSIPDAFQKQAKLVQLLK